jgi:hypothetical protein
VHELGFLNAGYSGAAPTTEKWMLDTIIGGVISWQRQRTDISNRLSQVYLFRLEEELQMVKMELDLLRNKARVLKWVRVRVRVRVS